MKLVIKLMILYAKEKYKRCQLQQKVKKLETQLKNQDNDYTAEEKCLMRRIATKSKAVDK